MAGKFSFSEKTRLKKRLYFNLVFEKGIKTENDALIMWHLNNFLECNFGSEKINADKQDFKRVKLGIIISKKLGNSVKRNRIKRLLREAFRLCRQKIKDGTWLILNPKKNNIKDLRGAIEELEKIFKKAEILKI